MVNTGFPTVKETGARSAAIAAATLI